MCESNGGGSNCNDKEERTYTWRGKVGLMYASDYGYATSGGSEDTRSKCLNQNLYFWSYLKMDYYSFIDINKDHPDCYENDWLMSFIDLWDSGSHDWTITPISNLGRSFKVLNVGFAEVSDDYSISRNGVRPSVYLKSDVIVVDGNGSKDSPWLLELGA